MARAIQFPSVEIHIPISPTPYYLNLIHYFAQSLRSYGGRCRDATIVVTAGDSTVNRAIQYENPWIGRLGVDLRWVEPEDFIQDSYFATGYKRWEHDFLSDVVVMMDADMLIVKDFGDVLCEVYSDQVIAGMIAHKSPFNFSKYWNDPLFKAFGLEDVQRECEHTGWGVMIDSEDLRYCPPYFNFGFVAMPAPIARRIGSEFRAIFKKIKTLFHSSFWGQLALTVVILKLKIPYQCISTRYNFANVPEIEQKYASELGDARVVHLLYPGVFHRKEVFGTLDGIDSILTRSDLTGVNKIAQEVLRTIQPLVRMDSTHGHL